MAKRFELIVFDWDGTLMDSAAAIVRAIQAASADLGLPVPDDARARHVIGLGLVDALRHAVPDLAETDYPRMVERYRHHYLSGDHELALFDGTFDMVIETLVLCTVADPEATAAEIRRVLKPDGRFLFMEHVRSDGPRLGPWQDRMEKTWMKIADGCHCNRRTVPMLRANGFEVEVTAEQDKFPMPPVARPIVSGVARPQPAAAANPASA